MKWANAKLGDICHLSAGGDRPKVFSATKTEQCQVPIFSNGVDEEGLYGYTDKAKKEGDSITISARGNVGTVFYRKTDFVPIVRLLTVIPNRDIINARYLYYLLKVKSFLSTGAAQQQITVPNISNFEIDYIEDIKIQEKIASILSAYDDLIENYRNQIDLLMETSMRLYEEWFVNLRFPNHENVAVIDGLPEGWEIAKVGEVVGYEIGGGWGNDTKDGMFTKAAYVIRGTDFHSVIDGSITEVPLRYHTESNLSSRKLQDGDIIFEVSGGSKTEGAARTVFISQTLLQQLDAPSICASFCKLVRAKERNISKYLFDTFQYLRRSDQTRKFDKYSAGNIVNYRWADFLQQQEILIPAAGVLKKYTDISENLYQQVQNLAYQISKAKTARDLLLPKLIKGEIEV